MQAMTDFNCRTICKHKECQRHANLGVIDKNLNCECLQVQQLNGSTLFLENIVDLSHTLAQIMRICGIHECKAKNSVDIITYSFLHYDLICYCLDTKPKKRLRKEDIFHELGSKCLMNRVEAHLAYNIIKRGFKAFYCSHEEKPPTDDKEKPSFSEKCLYVHAAKKTAESFVKFDGLSSVEQKDIETKIKVLYKKFYDRMLERRTKPHDNCNCCFCTKQSGHLVYAKPPQPAEEASKQPKACARCPHCGKPENTRKPRQAETLQVKCKICHRLRNVCICAKYDYTLEWVGSMCNRPDMHLCCKDKVEQTRDVADPCQPQSCQHVDKEDDALKNGETAEEFVAEEQELLEKSKEIGESEKTTRSEEVQEAEKEKNATESIINDEQNVGSEIEKRPQSTNQSVVEMNTNQTGQSDPMEKHSEGSKQDIAEIGKDKVEDNMAEVQELDENVQQNDESAIDSAKQVE